MPVDFDSRLNGIVAEHLRTLTLAITRAVRQNLAAELGRYLAESKTTTASAAPRMSRAGKDKPRRILPCIAPHCGSPSKGPRFRYLCEKHLSAPRREYEAWREARRDAA